MQLKIALAITSTLLLVAITVLAFSLERPRTDSITVPEQLAMCTADAMICPDGTMVGRTGADCQFVCPDTDEPTVPVEKPAPTPEPEPSVVADCSTYDEQACIANTGCEPLYGPSFCDGTTCTTDQSFQGCTNLSQTSLLRVCPDEWIRNLMPMAGESPYSREYYIIDSQRRELTEFDNDWIANNCQLEASVVY